jgi:hypothetical protein
MASPVHSEVLFLPTPTSHFRVDTRILRACLFSPTRAKHPANLTKSEGKITHAEANEGGGRRSYFIINLEGFWMNHLSYIRRKANWIGHILCRNCLLKRVTEGKRKDGSDGKTRKKT